MNDDSCNPNLYFLMLKRLIEVLVDNVFQPLLNNQMDLCLARDQTSKTLDEHIHTLSDCTVESLVIAELPVLLSGIGIIVILWTWLNGEGPLPSLTPEELQLEDLALASPISPPEWARDPVTLCIKMRPQLTIVEDFDPGLSHSYDFRTLHLINTQFHGRCSLTNRPIIRSLPNRPLEQAIRDWVLRQQQHQQTFFQLAPRPRVPGWARSELSGNIMTHPCLALLGHYRIVSIDRAEALERRIEWFINRNLSDAIAELGLNPDPDNSHPVTHQHSDQAASSRR